MSVQERLAAWCLAIGFSRWYNNDSIKVLAELRSLLIDTAVGQPEKEQIQRALRRLTPGEAYRTTKPGNTGMAPSSVTQEQEDVATWLRLIEEGAEVDPRTAARLLGELHAKSVKNFNEVAAKLLASVGLGGPYSWASYSYGNFAALFEIARLAPEDLLWNLVGAPLKYSGGGNWSHGISETLQHILMSRAKVQGEKALRKGLECSLRMHKKWARGGAGGLELPTIRLGKAKSLKSNGELAAHSLGFLLASRSAEIIESALVGIHALVSHEPGLVQLLIKLADTDWKRHWVANSAEAWSALFPSELHKAQTLIDLWMKSGPLHLRVSSWIVLRRLAQSRGEGLPGFPLPSAKKQIRENGILQPPRQILASPAERRGSFNFVDRFRSAESTIERVHETTGADLERLQSEVADKLMAATESSEAGHWMEKVYCRGDTQISDLRNESVLDEAFDKVLRGSPIPASLQARFAQAYLTSEDPWISRFSPLPDDDPTAWPTEQELLGTNEGPPDGAAIREKLFLLTSRHRVPVDEIVIAGKVQVFTWRNDMVFRLWCCESSVDDGRIDIHLCPTTLNGRTFAFSFGDWWEPRLPHGNRPLAFAVGGQNRLSLSFLEFFPARLWITDFGWTPAPENPLVWLAKGQPVARYERMHGEPRSTGSGHPRQPIIARWLVKKSAWEELSVQRGPFRMFDDFETFQSNVEN